MASKPRTYSRLIREALILLGKQISLARKGRRMSEHDLAFEGLEGRLSDVIGGDLSHG